jgi:hypothetical protein
LNWNVLSKMPSEYIDNLFNLLEGKDVSEEMKRQMTQQDFESLREAFEAADSSGEIYDFSSFVFSDGDFTILEGMPLINIIEVLASSSGTSSSSTPESDLGFNGFLNRLEGLHHNHDTPSTLAEAALLSGQCFKVF